MGCCATVKDNNNPTSHQNIPQSIHKPIQSTDYNQPHQKNNNYNASILDADVHIEVPHHQNDNPPYVSQSPRPEWKLN